MTNTIDKASAHTRGPWRWMTGFALVGDHGRRPAILTAREIREQNGDGRLVEIDTDGPNARLIAAAPELLDALLAIVTECADSGSPFYTPEPPFGGDSYLPREFIDAAEAALAKALGKEGI